MRRTSTIAALSALAAVTLAVGCGRGGDAGLLPDEETFFMPTPTDDNDSARGQALCASDTQAYDELVDRIQTYNEAVADRIALLRLMQRSAARSLDRTGEFEYTATRNGFTATLLAVEDDEGAVSYTLSVDNPDGETVRLMEGEANADRSAGTWTLLAGDVRSVDVAWSRDGDDLSVERTATGAFGERTAVYSREAGQVNVTFSGPNHDAVATWNVGTKDGSIEVDGVTRCFDVDADNVDVCTVTCPDAG